MWHEMDGKLCAAAARGDVGEVERLIAGGADVNSLVDGMTPLHRATDGGHVAVIGALVKGGAHVDGADEDGWTPLMFAAWRGQVLVIDADRCRCRRASCKQVRQHRATLGSGQWAPGRCTRAAGGRREGRRAQQ